MSNENIPNKDGYFKLSPNSDTLVWVSKPFLRASRSKLRTMGLSAKKLRLIYPKLIHFLHTIGQTDEISLDLTHETQLDLNRVAALKLLKEVGELN
jgi:hypothetical protein